MKRSIVLLTLLIWPLFGLAMEEDSLQDNWSKLPTEVQSYILSFIVNTHQITSMNMAIFNNQDNKKDFLRILNQWALLKLVSKNINNLVINKQVFNLNKVIKFCKTRKIFSDIILKKAAQFGKIFLLKKLSNLIDIDHLSLASQHNHHEFCKKLIELFKNDDLSRKAHKDHIDRLGTAIYLHDYEVVELWVQNEKDAICEDSDTAQHRYDRLLLAINTGDAKMVELILNIVDLKVKRGTAWTALGRAIRWGFIDIVRLLIKNGDDIHKQPFSLIDHPLNLAAEYGQYDIAQLLLTLEAEIDKANFMGETPLIIAAKLGKLDIVQLLLDNNADASCETLNGGTALSEAQNCGFLDIAQKISNYLEKTEENKLLTFTLYCLFPAYEYCNVE